MIGILSRFENNRTAINTPTKFGYVCYGIANFASAIVESVIYFGSVFHFVVFESVKLN
jgi:hypothetical protein